MVQDKYFVIDAHCHIYPQKIVEKAVAGTDNFYGVKSECYGTYTDLINCGAACGIDLFIVQSVATTPKQVQSINDFIAESVAQHPHRLTGLGTLHPDSEDIAGDAKHILSLGLHGVKIHPDIQRFALDDEKCLEMYRVCEEYALPMLIHTGDNRYDFSNPNRLFPVLRAFPRLTVVGAHFGGFSVWQEAAEKLYKIDNFFVDCSSTFPFIGVDAARPLVSKFTPDKILFGTDYPMWAPDKEIKRFLSLNLSEEDNQKIFSENAKKVYRLFRRCNHYR